MASLLKKNKNTVSHFQVNFVWLLRSRTGIGSGQACEWMSDRAKQVSKYHFRRVLKIAKSDYEVGHICPSVRRQEISRLPLNGFIIFNIWVLLEKSVKNIQISFKSNKNSGYFTRTFQIVSYSVLLRLWNVSNHVVATVKTHILYSKRFFFENRATFKIIFKCYFRRRIH